MGNEQWGGYARKQVVAPAFRQRSVPTMPTGDTDIDQTQETLRKPTDDLAACPLLHGAIVERISSKAGDPGEMLRADTVTHSKNTKIFHPLGRMPKGWIHITTLGPIWSLREVLRNDKYIEVNLVGDIDCPVILWVF